MAITRGTSADLGAKSGSSGVFTTPSFDVGATGQKVIVLVTNENDASGNGTVTGASITGGSAFSTAVHNVWGVNQGTNMFVLSTSLTGSQTFDITYTGGANSGFQVQVVVLDGAGLNNGAVDNSATNSVAPGTGATLSVNITVNTANSWVVMTGVDFAGGITASPGTNVVRDSALSYMIGDLNATQSIGSKTIGFSGNSYAGTLFIAAISVAPFVANSAFFNFMPN